MMLKTAPSAQIYQVRYKIGFVAGCFDIIHPGYVRLFKDAKEICDHLIVAVQKDPTLERPDKLPPVLPIGLRIEILEAIKYVDGIATYSTEKDLLQLLVNLKPDIRILGSDYANGDKAITGSELQIPIYIHQRSEWSSTYFKQLICKSMTGRE